jgi:hypothetical protein
MLKKLYILPHCASSEKAISGNESSSSKSRIENALQVNNRPWNAAAYLVI